MPITPNNFRVTDAIGETDNYVGADAQFFHIPLVSGDSSVVDLRTELGYDETVHNVTRTILQRGTIIFQRIDNANSGRIDITTERSGWTADTLETAIREMGATVGVNNKDVSLSHVVETELKLDAS